MAFRYGFSLARLYGLQGPAVPRGYGLLTEAFRGVGDARTQRIVIPSSRVVRLGEIGAGGATSSEHRMVRGGTYDVGVPQPGRGLVDITVVVPGALHGRSVTAGLPIAIVFLQSLEHFRRPVLQVGQERPLAVYGITGAVSDETGGVDFLVHVLLAAIKT